MTFYTQSCFVHYQGSWMHEKYLKTFEVSLNSAQSNSAKGRIAVLSPLATANWFVRSRPPSNTWFHGSRRVGPQTASRSVQPFLHSLPVCLTQTHRQTTLRSTSMAWATSVNCMQATMQSNPWVVNTVLANCTLVLLLFLEADVLCVKILDVKAE